ncbi:alpha/beta hydrolase fold domain-containing protein [Marinobacter segnicrescens]|uniref:alpha/beta hydrolase fold domain-containing protein n=1 Tax=Marinobacter segnicrescens TaxID=430453 RepID=UPI003A921DF2
MTRRIVLSVLLALPFAGGLAEARQIPPVSLEISGEATPELLADFRQALRRMEDRLEKSENQVEADRVTGQVDLGQFWKVEQDIDYTVNRTSPRQRLNIIYPFEGEPPYRTIVYFHEGDWQSGNRTAAADAVAYQAIYQGYALVNVGYRLADQALWPGQLHDAKAAIRFLRANGEQYQLDTEHLVAWGRGSGGHIAQMLGATNNNPAAEDPGMGYAEASSKVQGVVSWNGASDITNLPEQTRDAADALTGYLAYMSELALEASPVAQVSEDFPPILLVHDTGNRAVPFEQSARMAIRVNAATGEPRATLRLVVSGEQTAQGLDSPDVMFPSLDFVDALLYPLDGNPHRSSFFPGIQTVDGTGQQ